MIIRKELGRKEGESWGEKERERARERGKERDRHCSATSVSQEISMIDGHHQKLERG